MNRTTIMQRASEEAFKTMRQQIGGPFGAAVVKNGQLICVASNSVLKDNDPTAHAEMNAIRIACDILGTYDLSECELYATGYPCPMCLGAIMWANIKTVYYCNTVEEAEEIGFRDNFFYNWLDNKDIDILSIEQLREPNACSLYKQYAKNNNTIY